MRKLILFLTFIFSFSFSYAQNDEKKAIEVFFTKNDPIHEKLIENITSAQFSIYAALYEINYKNFADQLIEKKKQGIEIKIVTDSDFKNHEIVKQFIQADIPVVFDEQNSLMHNKFIIIDHKTVWTGSTNITRNCLFKNRNNAILFHSQEIAQKFTEEFLRLFEQKDFSHQLKGPKENYYTKLDSTHVNYYFSPKNGLDAIVWKRLQNAKTTIQIAAFALTHPKIIAVLKQKIDEGLRVEVLLDNRMSKQKNSASHKIEEDFFTLYKGKGEKLHHKFMVIDYETVITGSFNFSKNAANKNNENLVILTNPEIAALYLEEFERLKE